LTVPRLLDALGVVLLALGLVILATGGFRVAGSPLLERVENVVVALAVVAALRHLVRPYPLWPAAPRRLVILAVVVYVAVMSFITVTRHYNLRTHAVDLGVYDQVVWAIAHLGGPYSTMPEMHLWGDHFTPILYGMAPLYWLAPGTLVMLIGQCLALAVSAFAVWGLGRRLLEDERWAALAAVLFLMNPSLHGLNLRDFRPQAFAIPLLLAALYFFETARHVPYWGAVLLTLSCREDAALPVLGLGAFALLVRRRPWTGATTAVIGLGWLLVTTRWVIPYFRGETYSHLRRWGRLGGSVTEIVVGMLAQPGEVLATLVAFSRLKYLLALLAPWAFLPLLGPGALLGTLPTLAANLLSTDPVTFHHRTQYNGYLLPFLALAAIVGVRRLAGWRGERGVRLALGLALMISLAMTARTVNDLTVTRWWPEARTRDVHALVARVPPGVVVGADERIVPHVAHRPRVYIFPQRLEICEWLLIDVGPGSEDSFRAWRLDRRDGTVAFVPLEAGPEQLFSVVETRGTLLLARRGG
jgi:uncharacterized membrane protein